MFSKISTRRVYLTQFLLLCGLTLAFFASARAVCSSTDPNPIIAENCQPGTTDWMITPYTQAADLQLDGYPSLSSVTAGGTIGFHIRVIQAYICSGCSLYLQIYRLGYYGLNTTTTHDDGKGARLVATPGYVTISTEYALPVPDSTTGLAECSWPQAASWSVPSTAVSGFYIVKMTAINPNTPSMVENYIPFVVKEAVTNNGSGNPTNGSPLLFQTSITTHQAYNNYPGLLNCPDQLAADCDPSKLANDNNGKSLYGQTSGGTELPGYPTGVLQSKRVSFNRPYRAYNIIYDTLGESFINYEYPMIRWLEKEGYNVSYITDLDTHSDGSNSPKILQPGRHKVFLSVGHDEYWSWEMRENIKTARDASPPLNLAFFSANTAYWQVRFDPSNAKTMIAHKEYARPIPSPLPKPTPLTAYQPSGQTCNPVTLSPPSSSGYDPLLSTDPNHSSGLWRWNPSGTIDAEDEMMGIMTMPPEGTWQNPCSTIHILSPGFNSMVWTTRSSLPSWLTSSTSTSSIPGLIGYESDEFFTDNYSNRTEQYILGNSSFNNGTSVIGNAQTIYFRTTSGAKVFAGSGEEWSWGLDSFLSPGTTSSPDVPIPGRADTESADAKQLTKNILQCFQTNSTC